MGSERQLKAFRKVGKVCVKEMNARQKVLMSMTYSTVEFSCLFCNTKISEFFDMTKSWATFCCSGT